MSYVIVSVTAPDQCSENKSDTIIALQLCGKRPIYICKLSKNDYGGINGIGQ